MSLVVQTGNYRRFQRGASPDSWIGDSDTSEPELSPSTSWFDYVVFSLFVGLGIREFALPGVRALVFRSSQETNIRRELLTTRNLDSEIATFVCLSIERPGSSMRHVALRKVRNRLRVV